LPRQTTLPPSLPPRLVSHEVAAAYVCVSPNTFDQMVKNGSDSQPTSHSEVQEMGRAFEAVRFIFGAAERPDDVPLSPDEIELRKLIREKAPEKE
jgi:hypothetical protein